MFLTKILEKQPKGNAAGVTQKLIKQLKIPVTNSSIIDQIESHPLFPSLFSITDNLRRWHIEHLALDVDPEQLENLPTPFIAHKKTGGGNFIVVHSVNGTVGYIDENGKKVSETREQFLRNWSRIALVAEKTEGAGEKDYSVKRRKEIVFNLRLPILFFALVVCCIGCILSHSADPAILSAGLLMITKLIGTAVAGLLLWFEVDKANPIVKQFCTGSKNTNCTAILNSKAAKVLGVSWSEIGYVYFASGLILLLISAHLTTTVGALSWLSMLALPYTAFSLFYQGRIARQWCPLCLITQAIIATEALIGGYTLLTKAYPFTLTGAIVSNSLLALCIPVMVWIFLKPLALQAQKANTGKKELNKIKYNAEVFHAVLQQRKPITFEATGLGITIGNPQATQTIVKVCNPYCGPCAKAHGILEELIAYNNDVKVQIIFTVTAKQDDYRMPPVRHLLAIAAQENIAEVQRALDAWYGAPEKDYDSFAKQFPVSPESLAAQTSKIEAMDEWCTKMNIAYTPTLFINGYQLPEAYNVTDLNHFL